MSTLRDLAVRLRRLRQRHELTQEQFAEVAGISYKFYQQIEAARKKQIWLETVERLASGFGLQAWELLTPVEPAKTIVAPVPQRKPGGTRRGATASTPTRRMATAHLAAAEEAAPYAIQSTRRKRPVAKRSRKEK